MADRILVAYATKCGSTEEVAQSIARVLRESGLAVDTMPVKKVVDLAPYAAVVLGTAIRMGKPVGESGRFVRRLGWQLRKRPVALFSVGLCPREKTPEKLEEALGFLGSLSDEIEPMAVAAFAGKIDHAKLGLLFRFAASRDKSGSLAEGDWRDWQAIETWAGELVRILTPAA